MLGLQIFLALYLERVVFPNQHLLFEAVKEAQLEIRSAKMAGAIPADTIVRQQLQVNAGEDNR